MGLKSSGDGRQKRLQPSLSTSWHHAANAYSTSTWKMATLANFFFSFCTRAPLKTRFWPQPQLTKGVNDAIKHGAHKMDWLLMKAGKWGVGKVAVLPEETAAETSARYDVVIQQYGRKRSPFSWHKVARCVAHAGRGHDVSKSSGCPECGIHLKARRKRRLSDTYRNGWNHCRDILRGRKGEKGSIDGGASWSLRGRSQ